MLELMSDARRAEIKARMEAATKGPWIYHPEDVVISAGGDELAPQGSYIAVQGADATDGDMFFIAHAPEDIRDLFAENTSLRDELERVTRELEGAKRDMVQACWVCKHHKLAIIDDPCCRCSNGYGNTMLWEWRGLSTPTDHAQGAEGGGEG